MHARCIEPAPGRDAELSALRRRAGRIARSSPQLWPTARAASSRPLDAADTRCTRRGIVSLVDPVEEDDSAAGSCAGAADAIDGGARIDCGASGTSARFLAALAALGARASRRRRLAAPARAADGGADRRATRARRHRWITRAAGLPVTSGGPMRGGAVTIAGDAEQQFASALLLVAAALARRARADGGAAARVDRVRPPHGTACSSVSASS
jgi:hypothetical protein